MDTLPPHAQIGNPPQKYCSKCEHWFPATHEFFYLDSSKRDGLSTRCKGCKYEKKEAFLRSGYKVCSKCRQEKPATTENFSRDKRGRDGLHAKCKQCMSKRKPKISDVPQGHKRCCKCNAVFPSTTEYFHRSTTGKDGLYSRCKSCRLANIDREYKRIYDVKWHRDNREHCAEVTRIYRQTERGIIAKRARAHNRRARKRNAIGTHTVEELHQQLKRQKGKCYYCHKKLGKGRDSWNGDHVIPLSRGGTNYIDNIVIACPSCNSKKNNKLPHEWAEGGRLL